MTTYTVIRPYRRPDGKLLNHHGRVKVHRVEFGLYTPAEITAMVDNDDYIPVSTANELDGLRNTVTQTMGAGTQWEAEYTTGLDKKYVQVRNIDLATYTGWVGIPLTTNSIYDGNELFVSNLQNDSLFGDVQNSEVLRNIKVVGANIITSVSYKGILANRANLVQNCFVQGSIISSASYVGGISGHYGIIHNCIADVYLEGASYVGGISGTNASCYNCVSSGILKADNYVSGICTFMGAKRTYKNCYSTCDIHVETSYGAGLIAALRFVDGILENSYYAGVITAAVGATYIGGCVGRLENASVINSYYDVWVSGQSDTGKGEPRTTAQMKKGYENAVLDVDGNDDPTGDAIYEHWNSEYDEILEDYVPLAEDIWKFTPQTQYPTLL